jgi:hypothetical protein
MFLDLPIRLLVEHSKMALDCARWLVVIYYGIRRARSMEQTKKQVAKLLEYLLFL